MSDEKPQLEPSVKSSRGFFREEVMPWLIALVLLAGLYTLLINPIRDIQRTVHRLEEKVDRQGK